MEHTLELNLTEEEIEADEKYKGNLQPTMRMSMVRQYVCSLMC